MIRRMFVNYIGDGSAGVVLVTYAYDGGSYYEVDAYAVGDYVVAIGCLITLMIMLITVVVMTTVMVTSVGMHSASCWW